MRVQAIIHQQVFQLKWYLLACLGLIMVMPIEEAVVGFSTGDGFYSTGLAVGAVMMAPFLAGIIACANVQGDLSDKRYIFWRSKPANVKKLMALKFFIGLIASFVIIACPLIFAVVTTAMCGENMAWRTFNRYIPVPILASIMTYSLCFLSNVLVRNMARSWLIGMLLAGLILVVPFILPLGITDIVSDLTTWTFVFCTAIMLVASVAALVLAIFAAEYDWHLRTNLKGLLCVAAAMVFLLLMLFSSQVASIRVLDEKQIEYQRWLRDNLNQSGNTVLHGPLNYVDIGKEGMLLRPIESHSSGSIHFPVISNLSFDSEGNVLDSEGNVIKNRPGLKYHHQQNYPRYHNVFYVDNDGNIYYFGIKSFYRIDNKGQRTKYIHEKAYLIGVTRIKNTWIPIAILDISDFVGDGVEYLRLTMRLIDNVLVACVHNSYIVVDVTNPQKPIQIDRKLDVIPGGTASLKQEDRSNKFSIPNIPFEGISEEERIRLSIDLRYRYRDDDNDICDSTVVSINNGKIAFFSATERDIARFDVTGWDEENIYCRFSTARPYTILERMSQTFSPNDRSFVRNQKLYVQEGKQLMAFDTRSDSKIRKLGHFYRMDCHIDDVAVTDDGKLILCAWWNKREKRYGFLVNRKMQYLYLLENPE